MSDGYRRRARANYANADGLLDALVAARLRRGLTVGRVAREMGVPVRMVGDIESGRLPLVSLLIDYAQEVGVVVDYTVTDGTHEPVEPKGDCS